MYSTLAFLVGGGGGVSRGTLGRRDAPLQLPTPLNFLSLTLTLLSIHARLARRAATAVLARTKLVRKGIYALHIRELL